MQELCEVIISMKDNIPSGLITGFEENLTFDPINILTELSYKHDILDMDDFDFDDWDYSQEYAFGIEMPLKDEERKQYVSVVKGIKKLIQKSYKTHNAISLSELELLKPFFDITFQFTPSVDAKVPYPLIASEHTSHKRYVHYNFFSMDTILKKGTDLYEEYFYQCYTHSDLVFSILHFLALNEYKFNKCIHCGRFFATQSLKNLYCSRFSQYPDREKYTCYEAVKRIKQDIKRKHSQIYNNLSNNYHPDQLNKFEMEFHNALDELSLHPDFDSINKCYKAVDKKRWYNKKSVRVRGEKK